MDEGIKISNIGHPDSFMAGRDGAPPPKEEVVKAVYYGDISAEVMQSMAAEVTRGLEMRDSRHQPFTPEMEDFWKGLVVDIAKIPDGAQIDFGRSDG